MKSKIFTTILLSAALTACATSGSSSKSDAVVDSTTKSMEPTQPKEKVAKSMQSVAVSTTPQGANCTIAAGENTLGTVASTPGNAAIKRMNWKLGANVTCSKEGYVTKTGRLGNNPDENAMGGNIGAIFNAVKMIEGSLAAWDDSVHVKLDPAYFTSTMQRDKYLDAETALLNSRFTNASEKYLTCKKKKCTKKLAKLQTAYDADLATLKTQVAAIPMK